MNLFNIKKISQLLAALILTAFAIEGVSMSFLSESKEVVLFSPMEGILTLEGKPLAGVKIELKLKWYDGKENENFFTESDEKGFFNFPAVNKTLKIGFSQLVISQEITVKHKEEETIIWYMSKFNQTEYSELGGKPVNLRCELSSDELITRDYNTPLITRCVWDSLEPWTDPRS